jgi:hypothetical protein
VAHRFGVREAPDVINTTVRPARHYEVDAGDPDQPRDRGIVQLCRRGPTAENAKILSRPTEFTNVPLYRDGSTVIFGQRPAILRFYRRVATLGFERTRTRQPPAHF